MIANHRFSKFKILLLFIYLVPVLILILFIANFSVNVPYWDQWNLVNLFEKVYSGKASFGDFFAQNNEHRLVFPLLIIVPLAFLTKWDIRAELYLSVFFSVITFVALYQLSLLHIKNQQSQSLQLTNILTCFLIFSLVQYGNWLWGFQLAWILINTCLVIAVLIITSSATKHSKRLYFAAIPCFIASFSLAQGLLTWLAVIPSVVSVKGSLKQKQIRFIIWILLFVGTFALYLIDYQKPQHNVNTLFFLKEPLVTLQYFLTLLGTPLVHSVTISPLIGLIIFLTYLVFTAHYLKKSLPKLQLDSKAAPWISIGLFSLLFALMTTVGRASLGVEQAMSSRYTTSSVLLIIATIHLWRLFSLNNVLLTGIITVLLLINSVSVIPQAGLLQLHRQVSKTCLELVNFIDESPDSCLRELYPSTIVLREFAGNLEKLGFRKFPKDLAFIAAPVKDHGFIDSPPTGGITCTLSKSKSGDVAGWIVRPDGYLVPPPTVGPPCTLGKSGSLNLAGWAILPNRQELPKTVLLSSGSNRSFFANAVVNLDSLDVAKSLNSSKYNKVRWSVDISSKSLPIGESVIKAWVYDQEGKQFVKLNGEPKIKVVE